jgi:hypothetical protein
VRDVVNWLGTLLLWLAVPAALVWLLYATWRRGWAGRAVLVLGALLVTAWVLSAFAVDRDFHDADGWADCWPSCSPLQRAVPIALLAGPVYLVVLAVAYGVLAIVRRRRG